ncbi:FAD-dependent oxidoreductase [Streptomyces sp. NPDC018045]|uniref:FAD-dependent oxidoreductase n=1 Tax=Streptomyces sp. NPDC018045 TaxID=3365037 RepID=UPI003795D775
MTEQHTGTRAVVLGGSMAGLLAARVLSERFGEVVVVDRDVILGAAGPRRGVPHGRHAHGLVARGHQVLEELFPGLTAELRAAGAEPGDFNGDIRWYFNGRRLRPGRSGLVSVPATRPVLESQVRERVRALANVLFRERTDIVGLSVSPDRRRVLGARVQPHGHPAPVVIDADLVVDATGRGSRTPTWLDELGYRRPDEDRVKIDLAYTTAHFKLRGDPLGSDVAIIPVATPAHPRGALLYRVPGRADCVELSLTGVLGDHPPTDPEGFLRFAASLPVPDIHRAVGDAELLDEPVMFRFPMSVRRRYERLPRFPERFVVMGDAVCSFNPVYGQGMSVAAQEALVLRRHLARGSAPDAREYFRDLARVVDAPWDFSAGADLGYAGVEGHRTAKIKFANAYVARLQDAAVHDATLANSFMRVAGLMDAPATLMSPHRAFRVLRHGLRRGPRHGSGSRRAAAAGPAATRPASDTRDT